ncbi:hypothetical protein [Staphylococcus equorum]|jgi:uncharacterized membrane protein YcaP (DUF421 family)|uniref:hypothetical protein n=1 Tax=Staphylococcus equorum TaxID=246432 RepID=UPI00255351FC|nr:hypothetical protein [Staphylococcus equorum]
MKLTTILRIIALIFAIALLALFINDKITLFPLILIYIIFTLFILILDRLDKKRSKK